ncbi:hypothetical protein MUP77_18905 [Candidatus Bathyarchaeota archaeon]|nr:hypothetical protein [Candidatus Bathyarchaeota archaeon]
MVKFQTRWMTKSYKGKNHRYRMCSVNFPVVLHDRVEAKSKKDFDVDWSEHETGELEIITVTFTRNKLAKKPSINQSEKS